jgi:hypothetical protein
LFPRKEILQNIKESNYFFNIFRNFFLKMNEKIMKNNHASAEFENGIIYRRGTISIKKLKFEFDSKFCHLYSLFSGNNYTDASSK